MTRARDLGIPFDGSTGPYNAITDVAGVEVGHCTRIDDQYAGTDGCGRIRTGVTIIHPRGRSAQGGVAAGRATLNGTGEWTGMHLVDEIGRFYGPVALTGTGSLGIVHRAMTEWSSSRESIPKSEQTMRLLAVVGETLDSQLHDVFSHALTSTDVFSALDEATDGPVAEGNVGGGTGMMAYEFKGGIGTSSRVVSCQRGAFKVGALVQANHALRGDLIISGVRVGTEITDLLPHHVHGDGQITDGRRSEGIKNSLLIVLATDAPLMPHQLQRLARRAALGVGRNGSTANNLSGELALAFSTAGLAAQEEFVDELDSATMSALFSAAVQAVEEALINQLIASTDMLGNANLLVHAIPHAALIEVLARYKRVPAKA